MALQLYLSIYMGVSATCSNLSGCLGVSSCVLGKRLGVSLKGRKPQTCYMKHQYKYNEEDFFFPFVVKF